MVRLQSWQTVELGIHTSISDLSTTRDFIKADRKKLQAFMMAFSEAIWLGKTNKDIALKIFRKYMKTDDPKRLEKISAWLRWQGEACFI